MKQSEFNDIKNGFKEAIDFLKGKNIQGITKDTIHVDKKR